MAFKNKNEERWADLFLKDELPEIYEELKKENGKSLADILIEINDEISKLTHQLDNAADPFCLSEIAKKSKEVEKLLRYAKEII